MRAEREREREGVPGDSGEERSHIFFKCYYWNLVMSNAVRTSCIYKGIRQKKEEEKKTQRGSKKLAQYTSKRIEFRQPIHVSVT